mmetsp:Transcript_44468/g.87243  ORF Transcript_44468/g.87243 Transcript_44468/m.87243 type:complete len:359 (-) Transcript_44468:611-1687(-)
MCPSATPASRRFPLAHPVTIGRHNGASRSSTTPTSSSSRTSFARNFSSFDRKNRTAPRTSGASFRRAHARSCGAAASSSVRTKRQRTSADARRADFCTASAKTRPGSSGSAPSAACSGRNWSKQAPQMATSASRRRTTVWSPSVPSPSSSASSASPSAGGCTSSSGPAACPSASAASVRSWPATRAVNFHAAHDRRKPVPARTVVITSATSFSVSTRVPRSPRSCWMVSRVVMPATMVSTSWRRSSSDRKSSVTSHRWERRCSFVMACASPYSLLSPPSFSLPFARFLAEADRVEPCFRGLMRSVCAPFASSGSSSPTVFTSSSAASCTATLAASSRALPLDASTPRLMAQCMSTPRS